MHLTCCDKRLTHSSARSIRRPFGLWTRPSAMPSPLQRLRSWLTAGTSPSLPPSNPYRWPTHAPRWFVLAFCAFYLVAWTVLLVAKLVP
jgi:hypothetical protein